jgi:hypothetical protein
LVDTDDVTYAVETLRRLKADHERRCQAALAVGGTGVASALVAFGPEIICVGDIVRAQGDVWKIGIEHFVAGVATDLIRLSGAHDRTPPYDRYVVVNSLGEARALTRPLAIERTDAGLSVRCHVAPPFERTPAQSLPKDFALSAKHDLMAENGDIATVSGVAALPQRLLTCLSMRRGESPFHPQFGSLISEYWTHFAGSPWLAELLKLEVARLASVPYVDPVSSRSYTPLQCVERVDEVAVIGAPEGRRLPVRLHLVVAGLGAWSRDLAIFVG